MADLVGRCFGYSAFLTFLFCSFFWLFAARGQTWHGQLFWSLRSPWLKSHAADVQKSDPIWCTPGAVCDCLWHRFSEFWRAPAVKWVKSVPWRAAVGSSLARCAWNKSFNRAGFMEAPELCLACWEWDEARYAEAIYILSTDCHPYRNLRDILALSTLSLFSLQIYQILTQATMQGQQWWFSIMVTSGLFSLFFTNQSLFIISYLCAYVSLLLIITEGGRSGHCWFYAMFIFISIGFCIYIYISNVHHLLRTYIWRHVHLLNHFDQSISQYIYISPAMSLLVRC